MQCSIDKNSLRKAMKQKRSGQACHDITAKSLAVCLSFEEMAEFQNAKWVCVYMNAFGEVDTSHIIDACRRMEKDVAVPVVEGEDIYLCRLSGRTHKGAFGIQEPEKKEIIPVSLIDVFAVPGLAFDSNGARVGFGKGYYDKLLAQTNSPKVGLLYEFQLVEQIPYDSHDIFMDYLITERQVIHCAHI